MKLLQVLDMNGNQIINASIETVDTEPDSGVKGQLIYVDGQLKVFNGEDWDTVGTGGGGEGGSTPIDKNITADSTNSRAAGAKAVYDFVTKQSQNSIKKEDIDASISEASSESSIASSKAVKDYVDNKLSDVITEDSIIDEINDSSEGVASSKAVYDFVTEQTEDLKESIEFTLGASNKSDVVLTSNGDSNTTVKVGDELSAALSETGVEAGEYGKNYGGDEKHPIDVHNNETITVPIIKVDDKGRVVEASDQQLHFTAVEKVDRFDFENQELSFQIDEDNEDTLTWTIELRISENKYPMVQIYEIETGSIVVTDVRVDKEPDPENPDEEGNDGVIIHKIYISVAKKKGEDSIPANTYHAIVLF